MENPPENKRGEPAQQPGWPPTGRHGKCEHSIDESLTCVILWHHACMTQIAISAARSQLGDLVRRAAHGRETIALTDHGHVAALLVSPQVIEDLEDALAVADYQRRKAEGTLGDGIPMAEVRRRLGLEQK